MGNAGKWGLGVLALAAMAGVARGMEVKPGGLVYAQYAHETSPYNTAGVPGRDRGGFEVTRAYAIMDAKASDDWRGRVTLEGNTTAAGNAIFLKHAFVEAVNAWPDGVVSFGMIPATWNSFEEEIWGRRYVSKVLADQEGVLYSVDKGLAASGKLPGGYGSFRAGVFNGEGPLTPEQQGIGGRGKDASVRLSLTPEPVVAALAGVRVHGFGQAGKQAAGTGRFRSRYVAGASWEGFLGSIAGHWLWAKTGSGPVAGYTKTQGFSGYGSLKVCSGWTVFARGDWFDPSAAVGGDARERIIAGIEMAAAEGLRFALDNQHVRQQRTTAARRHENLVVLHAELKF